MTNHGIPSSLQDAVFEQAKAFFALPLEEKMKTSLSQFPPFPSPPSATNHTPLTPNNHIHFPMFMSNVTPNTELSEVGVKSNPHNRGYEPLRSQSFEKGSAGDLKEGFYLGRNLPNDHPAAVGRKFNMGPNQYPESVGNPEKV